MIWGEYRVIEFLTLVMAVLVTVLTFALLVAPFVVLLAKAVVEAGGGELAGIVMLTLAYVTVAGAFGVPL